MRSTVLGFDAVPNAPRTAALGLAACLLCGCGVQLGGALHGEPGEAARVAATLAGRLVRPRGHGAFAGAQVALSDPAPQAGFGLRNVTATAGQRWLWEDLSLEVGLETGVGEPVSATLGGTGLYVGSSGALLVRLSGKQDAKVGFAPAAVLVDAVLTGRAGVWSPPFDAAERDERFDLGAGLAIRITGISDLFVAEEDGWVR